MTALSFAVVDIASEPYAVDPQLAARIRITETAGVVVHSVALRARVRIEPGRRRYGPDAHEVLGDLFGTRDRWNRTLGSFAWLETATMVPGFTGECDAVLPLSCTYDFEVAASRYLHALEGGTVPLQFLFNGTVFGRGSNGVAVEPISWDGEARYEMAVSVWHDMVRAHFPGTGFVRLDHDTLVELTRYKVAHGCIDFGAVITDLLARAAPGDPVAGESS